jgi:hypothetical protein
MLTSRNLRFALAVAFALAAALFPVAGLGLLLARAVLAVVIVALSWPWRRCGQCRRLVTRRYVITWEDGSCERLCLTCGARYQHAELAS